MPNVKTRIVQNTEEYEFSFKEKTILEVDFLYTPANIIECTDSWGKRLTVASVTDEITMDGIVRTVLMSNS